MNPSLATETAATGLSAGLSAADLQAVEDRANAAVDGEWHVMLGSGTHQCTALGSHAADGSLRFVADFCPDYALGAPYVQRDHLPTMHFVQRSRADVLALVAEVRAQTRRAEQAEAVLVSLTDLAIPAAATEEEAVAEMERAHAETRRVVNHCVAVGTPDDLVTEADKLRVRDVAILLMTVGSLTDVVRGARIICHWCQDGIEREQLEAHVAECSRHPMAARIRELEGMLAASAQADGVTS